MVAHDDVRLLQVNVFEPFNFEANQRQPKIEPGVNMVAEPNDVPHPRPWEHQKCEVIKWKKYQPKQEKNEDAVDCPEFSKYFHNCR